ncbi:DNA polymerase I [Candidatus Azobacteroides pseudotrichonymphae]|uniref:DNA polymerase I n=1 Tax=Azobacteroides pseudotrichonymphae genomovar. CFP2 TaxID=511995 RepID=B6YQQ9_AZOPC|nr:DNA polymerase I [Candidatus Azobacteroides pseudotrichonymphae]BAG83531.1 DNA polymerase I [Candidatus Azobacteroides pseudotrichonymphae genomovar. CFP2]
MKLFLLDAYALIYRAYYSFIKMPLINSKGFNTSAIFGFVNTLDNILRRENPTHIGVAFDPIEPTFRHQVFKQYKAQREETPETIRLSIPIIKDIVSAYHIPILEVSGYEADDVIGTVAKKTSRDYEIFMMTPDKDYGQLVDEHIFIYKPRYRKDGFEILGVKEIKEKYGFISPIQMIDFLGLMGDSSDNIPGCPGIGEITAKKLIARFGSIENLLKNVHFLNGILKTKIERNKETILFSKFLATIKTDVPINFNPNELIREDIDKPVLKKIFEKLEFHQLVSRFFGEKRSVLSIKKQFSSSLLFTDKFVEKNNEKTETVLSNFDNLSTVLHKYRVIDKQSDIGDLINKIKIQNFFSFNIKTTEAIEIDPLSAELVGIAFTLQEGEAYFLPFFGRKRDIIPTVQLFKEIFESDTILKVGQNLKYDINVLKKYGIRMNYPIFDILIAHYLINPEYLHNLDFLAKTYLNYRIINTEELIGSKKESQLSVRQVPLSLLADYACENADIVLKLKNIFEPIIRKSNFSNLFYRIELPLVFVLSDMEEFGVKLDISALKDYSVVLNRYLESIEKIIFQISGKIFNVNSPKMVGEILFDHLKIIENSKKTKSGQYATSEGILENLKKKHPIVGEILKYRKSKKLLTTYIDTLPTLVSFIDKKIHTTYNQATTATGRLSSNSPNLQNIPIRDKEGKEIRRVFIPDDNCLFLSADYSQIELRIMAHLSEDKNMLEAFRNGQDIHSAIASIIFGVPLAEITCDMRRKAKITNFGIIYGISVFGLAEQLQVSRFIAKELINKYFMIFPDIKNYIDRSIAIARKDGYVETIFRRKRFLPDINSRNSVVRKYAERNSINAPIQGSAADIIKVAMNRIHRRLIDNDLQSKMIIQVHDELNFNVFIDELDKVKQIVVYEMEHATHLKVPLVVNCGIGKNWLEAH